MPKSPSYLQIQNETLELMLQELEAFEPSTPEEVQLLAKHRSALKQAVAARTPATPPQTRALKDTVAYQQAYLREIGEKP